MDPGAPPHDPDAPAHPDAFAPAGGRRSLLAAIDHPVALGFAATLGVLAALVLGLALGSISTILVYILLAMFVAIGLDPLVRALERRKVPRPGGIAIVFSAFAVLVVLFAVFVLPPVIGQVVEFFEAVPEALRNAQSSPWYQSLGANARVAVDSALDQLRATSQDPGTLTAIGGGVLAVGVGLVSFLTASFIVVALTLYFLASLPAIKKAFYDLAPARNRARLAEFTERITSSIGSALIGSVILAALNAGAVFLIHVVIGLPFAALMAVVAFVITLIPLFGSMIFLVIGTIVALFSSPAQALIFAIAYLVYVQLESYVLSPRIMNRAVSIPAALVLIGALVGGALMGIIGVLVALPVTASLLLILREVVVPRQDRKT